LSYSGRGIEREERRNGGRGKSEEREGIERDREKRIMERKVNEKWRDKRGAIR
jgi:hypothetical protein